MNSMCRNMRRKTDVVVRSNGVTASHRRRFCTGTHLTTKCCTLAIMMSTVKKRQTHYRGHQPASFCVFDLFTYWFGVVIVPR